MNLNPHFYAQTKDDIMYYYYDSNKSIHKFFLNENLIGEYKKLIGDYSVTTGNIEHILNAKITKHTVTYKIDGVELTTEKVTKKQMRELLTARNIYNEVNPTKNQIENARFKLSELTAPVSWLTIGLILEYFSYQGNEIYGFMSFVPGIIAGFGLYKIGIKHAEWLMQYRKTGLFFILLGIAIIKIAGELLFR